MFVDLAANAHSPYNEGANPTVEKYSAASTAVEALETINDDG
jgi:hypothetical protein